MKTKQELKEELHRLIDSIEDEQVLHELNEDVVPYLIASRDEADKEEDDLTEEQLQRLDVAIKQAEEGKVITLDEFNRRMEGWRTK